MCAVMSQEQRAEKSGVARATISKLVTGQRWAYPATARKLAADLGLASKNWSRTKTGVKSPPCVPRNGTIDRGRAQEIFGF